MYRRATKLAWLLLLTGSMAVWQIPAQSTSDITKDLERINVTGTHYPVSSILSLSGLKAHDKVREIDVNTACHRITATGLFKSIDYTYDAYPDRSGVVLNLAIVDQGPLLPSSIKPPGDEAAIWTGLQAMDPIFIRQLPPTEKAITFYEKSIEKWLQANGRTDEYAAGNVVGTARGDPSAIVFEIRKYKSLPPKR